MGKNRLEAFSDGVLAISITDLLPLIPTFLSYVLSFLYGGIYWNNRQPASSASACNVASEARGEAVDAGRDLLLENRL